MAMGLDIKSAFFAYEPLGSVTSYWSWVVLAWLYK